MSSHSISTPTTVVDLTRLRGNSVLILMLLHDISTTTGGVAEFLGKNVKYAYVYLYRLRKYGLITRDKFGLWTTTKTGDYFIYRFVKKGSNNHGGVERKLHEDVYYERCLGGSPARNQCPFLLNVLAREGRYIRFLCAHRKCIRLPKTEHEIKPSRAEKPELKQIKGITVIGV